MFAPSVPIATGRAMAHVLVVEPDRQLRDRLLRVMSGAGYPTLAEAGVLAGLRTAVDAQPDLVLLGPTPSELPAAAAVSELRRAVPGLATVVLTAPAEENELIGLLDAGADDFLVEPYRDATLLARVRAVLRRAGGGTLARPVLRLGGLRIDLAGRRVELDGSALALSPREFDLLAYLGLRAGQVVSKRELLNNVWRLPYSLTDKTVDVHVSWLRRKLRESARRPRYLHTVRGAGLRLDIPPAGEDPAVGMAEEDPAVGMAGEDPAVGMAGPREPAVSTATAGPLEPAGAAQPGPR